MEDYVTYEQAVRLKELGFDLECLYYYEYDELCGNTQSFENEEDICICAEGFLKRHNIAYPGSYTYSAPTLAQVSKWLREEYKLHINVAPFSDSSNDADKHKCEEWYFWDFSIINVTTGSFVNDYSGDEFNTYEKALSAGIDTVLKLIDPTL